MGRSWDNDPAVLRTRQALAEQAARFARQAEAAPMPTVEPNARPEPTRATVADLVRRVRAGDLSAVAALRELVEKRP